MRNIPGRGDMVTRWRVCDTQLTACITSPFLWNFSRRRILNENKTMQRKTILSIPQACSETWSNMTRVPGGGFCSSCEKTVIDFTNMTDDEIATFLQHRSASVCGRFRPHQLKTYAFPAPTNVKPGYTLIKAGLLSLFLLLTSKYVSAQSATMPGPQRVAVYDTDQKKYHKNTGTQSQGISGTVVDKDTGEPLPAISVIVKGTTTGTATDEKGNFELPGVKAGDILILSFIGYESKEYVVPDNASTARITMTLAVDITILGGVAIHEVYEEPSRLGRMWARVKSLF